MQASVTFHAEGALYRRPSREEIAARLGVAESLPAPAECPPAPLPALPPPRPAAPVSRPARPAAVPPAPVPEVTALPAAPEAPAPDPSGPCPECRFERRPLSLGHFWACVQPALEHRRG